MSLDTAETAILAILRAGKVPDMSLVAKAHGTSHRGAEAAIRMAEDLLASEQPRIPKPQKKTAPCRTGIKVRYTTPADIAARKQADEIDRYAAYLPRTEGQR
jgi:hypothetical protein